MVAAAGVIAPALAGADQDAGKACPRAARRADPWSAARRLAHLDVDILVVERDLARDGDAAWVRAEIERSEWKAQRCRQPA